MLTLLLPPALRAQIIAEARAAHPGECCGLIEGVREGGTVRALALHPAANVSDDPAAGFEIDPALHLRLLRTLRGTGRELVGCYHSHPNGRAGPSARDRESHCEEGFIWIITDLESLAAFAGPAFGPVRISGDA